MTENIQFTGESEMKGRNGYTKLGSASSIFLPGNKERDGGLPECLRDGNWGTVKEARRVAIS